MNYASIKTFDIANGPGVRVSLFVSGCTHHCPGCFNEIAWDFSYGTPFTAQTITQLIENCRPDYITGITLLGGEPMETCNQAELLPFLKRFRAQLPDKSIWCYSGYTFEELTGQVPSRCRCEMTDEMLRLLDVLVDGRYEQSRHNITLRFRGSENQRLLDVSASLKAKAPVFWQDADVYATHDVPKPAYKK